MEVEYLEKTLSILEDKNININSKFLKFEELILFCDSNIKIINNIIVDEKYSYCLINITDYFGKNIKLEDENNSKKIMRYREWLQDNFFSSKATKKEKFDNIINE
ncbi:25088_t:CDS:1 [Cetraspora pellucida]|uniref:25088_t:CDS:1 n=1 Tax=Cetraspora pellucida TaxID=1433469 RepID=A0A9N9JS75_9GLOM|nr:25088_t:CDS:1 [Cetraspora pellucida]